MLFALFYYIICHKVTFEDKDELTQTMVKEKMNETIIEVFIKNINIIGYRAFEKCSNIEYVSFQEPITLTKILSRAFYECTELKSISIPSSVKKIGTGTFHSYKLRHL